MFMQRLTVSTKETPAATAATSWSPLLNRNARLIQRKCACGDTPGSTGECEECSKNKRLGLQTKLEVNEPGDIYEQAIIGTCLALGMRVAEGCAFEEITAQPKDCEIINFKASLFISRRTRLTEGKQVFRVKSSWSGMVSRMRLILAQILARDLDP